MSTSYEAEVLARYGETPAFAEYGAKTKKNRTEDFLNAKDALTAVFAEFAVLKASGAGAEGGEASALVRKLAACITEHFYTCTPEILVSLGEQYVTDPRFTETIDRQGEGTAAFVSAAIRACFDGCEPK
ncbi:MAG: TipAS antibiotic-recognition domain-containing protein [Clostridia bacterium]|nr:TipAS antibiotic-recognition domain-containing protein [Clostridia bacterium]